MKAGSIYFDARSRCDVERIGGKRAPTCNNTAVRPECFKQQQKSRFHGCRCNISVSDHLYQDLAL